MAGKAPCLTWCNRCHTATICFECMSEAHQTSPCFDSAHPGNDRLRVQPRGQKLRRQRRCATDRFQTTLEADSHVVPLQALLCRKECSNIFALLARWQPLKKWASAVTSISLLLSAGCMVPGAGPHGAILVEKPGVVARIPVPPDPTKTALSFGPIFAVVGAAQPALSAGKRTGGGPRAKLAAAECAEISECDGQDYELLTIAPDERFASPGRAAYQVILWNRAGIDWHAEIWLDVSWEAAKRPFATVVYRNTKEDSCLLVENGTKGGAWRVAQEMKFGKGAPAKEHAEKARPLQTFPHHKPSQP